MSRPQSVTTKGCSPSLATRNPCSRPIRQPIATTMTKAMPGLTASPATRSMKTTPSSAMIEPTDSSMPPEMMTKACATANMPNRPIRFAVFDRLIGDRKRGLMIATTVPTTMMRTRSQRSFRLIIGENSRRGEGASCRDPSDRERQYGLLAEFPALEEAGDAAFVHDRDAVADADDLLHV